MLSSALLVFREILEAACVISVLAAASRGLPGRAGILSGGIALGVLSAVLLAWLMTGWSTHIHGTQQALFNAGTLIAACLLITWHLLWVSRRGATLSAELRRYGHDLQQGLHPPRALAIVIALAVGREGAEIVIYLQSMYAEGEPTQPLLWGACIGLLGGFLFSWLIYLGILRMALAPVFRITQTLLLLVAAGMCARAGAILLQAGLLPSLGSRLWNSSAWIANDSILGRVLSTFVGYDAHPSGLQLLLFMATLSALILLQRTKPSSATNT